MGIPHIHQKLEDKGAACFWGRIESVSAADGAPTVYRWLDEINDRDYLAKCVGDGAFALWMPSSLVGNGAAAPLNRVKMVIPAAGLSYESAQGGIGGVGGNQNWGDMITPALSLQDIGFYGEGDSLSPLARRTKAQQTYPISSVKAETVPGSWSLSSDATFVAEHSGTDKIVTQFPFTLECWAKPTSANVGTDPSGGNRPGAAIMIAPPNNPESPNTAIAVPGDGWKCWGIGFKADTTNPGVPVIFWGGWEGHNDLWQAGPDPGRAKYPTSTTNPSTDEWQHIVGVFHASNHVQLFWNGREVGNYNANELSSFRDESGNDQAWVGKTIAGPPQVNYTYAPGLTAWMGGCAWHYSSGGAGAVGESQFHLAGSLAYPAVYRKALSNREVMHHFLTCRQAANITLRGEAQDYSGSAPQGVLKVERTKVSGLGRSDQILIYKDQITTGEASMEMAADGKAAIQQCGLPDPFPYLSGVTDDRRYHDGNQGGFTGYCIAGAVGAIFDSSIATIQNGFMAPMSWIGRPQWGVSGQELTNLTGMRAPIYSLTNNDLRRQAFIYADLQDPKNSGDISTSTVKIEAINSDKNSRLGTQVFCAKYEEGKKLEIGTQHEPEAGLAASVSDVGTIRLADTSNNDGAWTFLENVALAETPLVIGPHTLIGSPMPTQDVIRMLGGTPKLRTRQATSHVRRHYEINNYVSSIRQAGDKDAPTAPATQTTIGTVSVTGPQAPAEDTATSWAATSSGNANGISWAWSVSPTATVVSSGAAATITFPNPSTTYTVTAQATDSGASDSPASGQATPTTAAAGTAWTVSGTSGIANVLGALSAIQNGGDDTFDEMGLTQLNVGTTYAAFFFFTAYARDEFRTLTSFTLEGNSMNPSTATYEEQNASSNGFGLKYTGINSTCTAWIADMQGGSVSGSYVGTTDAMTVVQAITWTNSDPFDENQLASVSSTGTDIISANRDDYTTISSRPRTWNGAAAVTYGASSGSAHSTFQELSGGDAQSDNKACGHFWSMWGITMDNGDGDGHTIGSDQLTANIWPQYLGTQNTYNNNTKLKLLNTTAGAQSASFRVYRSYPKDNRFVKFTTGSTYGYMASAISIHGHTYFGPSRISWNGWDPGMIDYYPGQIGGEGTPSRDGMLKWMVDNGNLELWSGGSKVDDLTMSAGSTTRLFMSLDTLTTLTASTEYELRWT